MFRSRTALDFSEIAYESFSASRAAPGSPECLDGQILSTQSIPAESPSVPLPAYIHP